MKIEKIKEALRQLLVECNNVMTDKGNIFYDADEVAVNVAVYSDSEMAAPLEDGTYETDDMVITVEGGIVKEIAEKAVEEETVEAEEEPKAEEPKAEEEAPKAEEPKKDVEIEALKAEIDALKAAIEDIKAKIEEPVTEPIAEEFEKQVSNEDKWTNFSKEIRNLKAQRLI